MFARNVLNYSNDKIGEEIQSLSRRMYGFLFGDGNARLIVKVIII
jgi:hypothetical protein